METTKSLTVLTVLYDERCGFCRRCRTWCERQYQTIPLTFVPLQSPDVQARFPGIERFDPENKLVVVSGRGEVYQGESALIMCLFALEDYRAWARRLASPVFKGMVARVFSQISSHRRQLGQLLDPTTLQEPGCEGSEGGYCDL